MSTQNLVRSIRKSVTTPVQALVRGSIPKWVNGSLFRNGPGQYEFGNKYYKHLFDGAAVVNKFQIKDGNVYFSNKHLETEFYKNSIKTDGLIGQFGTNASKSSIFSRLKSLKETPPIAGSNTNVTVYPFANKHLYAMTELNRITRVNPDDLSVMSITDVTKYFETKTNIAHPHCLNDGSWINMGVFIDDKRKGFYKFFKYNATGEKRDAKNLYENGQLIATIPSSHADGNSYFHSFGISENYIIFLESPIKMVYKKKLMGALFNKPTVEAFETDHSFPTHIHVINQHTGEVMQQKFTTEAQFSFHHINAYEKKESEDLTNLIVDVCSFGCGEGQFNLHNLTYEDLDKGHLQNTDKSKAIARRIEIPLNKNSKPGEEIYCNISTLNEQAMEFPTINYGRNNGLPYKYMYAANSLHSKPFEVLKLDVENPEKLLKFEYNLGDKNIMPSEPIFVENPEPKSEDDGVLLVMVLSDENDYLSVLDAKDMKEIARADLPSDCKAAFSFHGFFADKAQMF